MTVERKEVSTKSKHSVEPTLIPSTEPHPMRRSTRVPWRRPVKLISLDPSFAVVRRCETLVVNFHGCALTTDCKFPFGTPVQLEVGGNLVTGRAVHAISLGAGGNGWMLGIALDNPGNVWGIEDPPRDWTTTPEPEQVSEIGTAKLKQEDSDAETFELWPSAIRPVTRADAAISPEPAQPSAITHDVAGNVRAEIERQAKTVATWLQESAEGHLQGLETKLRGELEAGLAAYQQERAAIEAKLNDAQRTSEQLQVLLNKAIDVLRAEVVPARDHIGEARRELEALIRSMQQKMEAESAALRLDMEHRVESEWTRLRDAVELHIHQAEVHFLSELQKESLAFHEPAADEEKSEQEIHPVNEEIKDMLTGFASALRSEFSPLKDQVIDQARDEVRRMLTEFRDRDEAERATREQRESRAAMQIDEVRNQCIRLQSGFDEEHSARESMRAQLDQILENRAEQERVLQQHRTDYETAQKAIAEQVDRACQARAAVESIVGSVPDTIPAQLQGRVDAAVKAQQESLSRELSIEVRAALEHVRAAVQGTIGETSQGFRQELSAEFERKSKQLHDATAAGMAGMQAVETSLHHWAGECSENIEVESKRAAAQCQEQLQRFTAERLAQVEAACTNGSETLHTIAGKLLTTMRHELLNDLAREQKQTLQLVQAKIHDCLREEQETVHNALQKTSRDVLDGLRHNVSSLFDERQHKFEATHAAATDQLLRLEKRTEELTAIVDVELQKHTDELVTESVAQTTQMLQQVSENIRKDHLELIQEEVDRKLGALTNAADEAESHLRMTLDCLRSENSASEALRAHLQEAVRDGQAWLERETKRCQQSVHDTFLVAAGEIRGRIRQAVEMASEPVERRSRQIQEEIAALVREQVHDLQAQAESTREGLHAACVQSESAAESSLKKLTTDALACFEQDLENLARSSISQWQSALTDSLAAIPKMLAANLPQKTNREFDQRAQGCAAEDEAGAG
jgi:hypothetical protein